MTDELLPPDPSVDGRYWLISPDHAKLIGAWHAQSHRWVAEDWRRPGTPMDLGIIGYTMASPHPIPGPAQLDALYALPDAIVKAEREASKDAPGNLRIVGVGAAQNAATMLRAALGVKS